MEELTWRALEAHMVVGAEAAVRLLLVDAPEALLQAGVDHLPSVCSWDPVGGASFHGNRTGAHSLTVVEADGLQSLVIPVAPGVVDVEPGRPLGHTCGIRDGERRDA